MNHYSSKLNFAVLFLLLGTVALGFQNCSSNLSGGRAVSGSQTTATTSATVSTASPTPAPSPSPSVALIEVTNPSQVTATVTYMTQTPFLAFDGNLNTEWSSGGYAPQSITVDLGAVYSVAEIILTTAQNPNGPTTHQIWGGETSSSLTLLTTISGNTVDDQQLTFYPVTPDIRYIQVTTTVSPSWVGWREIQIYQNVTPRPIVTTN